MGIGEDAPLLRASNRLSYSWESATQAGRTVVGMVLPTQLERHMAVRASLAVELAQLRNLARVARDTL